MRLKKIHPRTGEELAPLFVTKNGRTVWPQMGASPDDPSNDDGDDDDEGGTGTGTGSVGSDDDDDDGDDTGKGQGDTVTREEFEAVMRRMKAADKRASALEAEKKKQDDAKKDELTKAQERVTELEKTNADLLTKLRDADLRDAFSQVKGFTWKRPVAALRIARADGYLDDVVDDDGEIDNKLLAKKVKEFAEAYPELVNAGEEGGGNGSNGGAPAPPTGQPTGSGRRRQTAPDDSEIKKRYGHLLR